MKDLCELLERFERRDVALISVAESLAQAPPPGRLGLNINDSREPVGARGHGERTRDVMRHKRTNGERVGNIPFGYRLDADRKHVELEPSEQAVLQEIRRLSQQGHSMRRIAATLNRQALRTRRGTAWRQEHVPRIVKQGAVTYHPPSRFPWESSSGMTGSGRKYRLLKIEVSIVDARE